MLPLLALGFLLLLITLIAIFPKYDLFYNASTSY